MVLSVSFLKYSGKIGSSFRSLAGISYKATRGFQHFPIGNRGAVSQSKSVRGRFATTASFTTLGVAQYVFASDKMHSEKCVVDSPNVKIIGIPALSDNFMYLVIDKPSLQAVIVDPVEPDNVLAEVRRENVTLAGVLTTHHHWDHAGGNEEMVKKYNKEVSNSSLLVYGGDDRIGALTNKVGQGDIITVGSLTFHCHFTPCHTSGHLCYYLESSDSNIQQPAVFTGDTLFIAGCGRFFEGTAQQMHSALIDKLGKLPDNTMVFCGHEYTTNNLKFALSVEPDNEDMKSKLSWSEEQRKVRKPTIPSTIGEEKQINPFMRCILPQVQKIVSADAAVTCMGKLRTMKDSFKA